MRLAALVLFLEVGNLIKTLQNSSESTTIAKTLIQEEHQPFRSTYEPCILASNQVGAW